jgi:hypothetical protein
LGKAECGKTPNANKGVSPKGKVRQMISLGVLFLLLGFVLGIPILWTLGIVLLVVGAVLAIAGATGRPIGSRAHYW